jgi:sulfite reductase alpha subunit-like flavoprotein
MKKFWRFLLRKSLPCDSLSTLQFCVVGLGDSSYQKFNFVAKRLNKRLLQLGAKSFLPIALCDDQHDLGIGAVFHPWLQNFWSEINSSNPLPIGINPLPNTFKTTRWTVREWKGVSSSADNFYAEFEDKETEKFVTVLV